MLDIYWYNRADLIKFLWIVSRFVTNYFILFLPKITIFKFYQNFILILSRKDQIQIKSVWLDKDRSQAFILIKKSLQNFLCRAPEGCLQFFTGIGGQVTSFNFLDGVNPIMIRNLLYSVCIRAEKGKGVPVILMKYL